MSGEERKNMSQEMILGRLRERGFRITKQRKLIISTILLITRHICVLNYGYPTSRGLILNMLLR